MVILLLVTQPAQADWAGAPGERTDSCVICHSTLSGRLFAPVFQWERDVHRTAGINCHHCHGGDPSNMDSALGHTSGFTGVPVGEEVVDLCSGCHSSAGRMRSFALRIDQDALFRSSDHWPVEGQGKNTPTCTTCHGSHGILSQEDPLSPVYSLNIPELCGSCHGAGDWGTDIKEGSSPPWIFNSYRTGVHGRALLEDLNLRAPNCATCHGAHSTAAPPPELTPAICGRCHMEETRYFNTGPHRAALNVVGEPGCTGCHEAHILESPPAGMAIQAALETCPGCHPEDGKALQMGRSIVTEMEGTALSIDSLRRLREDISLRGFDTLQVDLLLQEAESWFSQILPAFHALSTDRIRELTGMTLDKVNAAEDLLQALSMELSMRRLGLLVISLLCFLTICLLAAKLRLLEKMEKDRKLSDLKDSADNQGGPSP
ncbi:MAG: cytochrome c3 family protein [bacterium]|nr:MAG: cytochrome c3 family protein [bacterium]